MYHTEPDTGNFILHFSALISKCPISFSHCDELHENSELIYGPLIRSVIPDKFQNNIMCAGNPETGESACHGDSGGPLVQFQGSKVNSNHYLQIGMS